VAAKTLELPEGIKKLNQAIEIIKHNTGVAIDTAEQKNALDEILKQGLILSFEYTHELAWNVMKDYAEYQGNNNVKGSRDATREAFKMELITNADSWMDMLKSRNDTSHTYNEHTADEIYNKIVQTYQPLFIALAEKMEALRTGAQSDIFEKDI
jgi:nucleotidyltransferase substrate binding protein (TIGR01987 family)